jgi:glycosyltransferase involved in cell wall biosynthesis
MPWPNRWKPWVSLFHAWRLARWIKEQRIQVLHCHEHDLYPFALVLRRLTSLPLVCYVHFAVERGFVEWAFGKPGREPDALIWTSHQQKLDCVQAVAGLVPPEKQHVIELGLDCERFGNLAAQRDILRQKWGIKPGEVVVGSACALRARKRVDDFISLLDRLCQEHAHVVALLAGGAVPGDEQYAEQIVPRLRALESRGRFRWLGHLANIEPFMHAIDVFVSTSEYETFGMSVCEAMTCRCPVAAYEGGSVREVVGDTGLVVPTGDLTGLTAAVYRLVVSHQLRTELGERGRARVAEHFNPARSLQQLKAIYSQLLGRTRAAS